MQLSSEQILALRPLVSRPQPGKTPLEVLTEFEPVDQRGGRAHVTTVLLRGSECSFRCLMCDLWKHTHETPTPAGFIPAQIETAISQSPAAPTDQLSPPEGQAGHTQRWIKLYNAANFFAPRNVPTEDLPAIARLVSGFDRVIVENHPRLLSKQIVAFGEQLEGRLEIAMGLETVEPEILASLNKQLSVEDVARAVGWLSDHNIDTRLFVLLAPPTSSNRCHPPIADPGRCHPPSAAVNWCQASIEAARRWGARHVSICPVRAGNGVMEHLQSLGAFCPPSVAELEAVVDLTVNQSPMIVTADLWEWQKMRGTCLECGPQRKKRLEEINLSQQLAQRIHCPNCDNDKTKCDE